MPPTTIKPGYLTTEFYVSVLAALGALIATLAGGIPGTTGAEIAAASVWIYTISRGVAKFGSLALPLLTLLPELKAQIMQLRGQALSAAAAKTAQVLIALLCIVSLGCTTMTPRQAALLTTAENLANVAGTAAATFYGGPMAGQLASAGLSGLASVLQGYVGTVVPATVVQASPGVPGVGQAVLREIATYRPISQDDVDTVHAAAAIAAALTPHQLTQLAASPTPST